MPQEEEEEERISLQHENMLLFFLSADFPQAHVYSSLYTVFWVWVWAEGESILALFLFARALLQTIPGRERGKILDV